MANFHRFVFWSLTLSGSLGAGLAGCGGSSDTEKVTGDDSEGSAQEGDGDGAPGEDDDSDSGPGGTSGSDGGRDGTGGVVEPGSGGGDSGPNSAPLTCESDKACLEEGMVCDTALHLCVECVAYTDCPEGNTCAQGECTELVSCESSKDCGSADLVCVQNEVLGGQCLECAILADCAEGEMCVSNKCMVRCESDKDCAASGELCNSGQFCSECVGDLGCADSEFCDGLNCQPQICDPGSDACLGTGIVTCNETGSGYGAPRSCNGFDCAIIGGEPKCDYPESVKPPGALNDNGDFAAGGLNWHLSNVTPVQVTDGMFCTQSSFYSDLGWPVELADAPVLTYEQNYKLIFTTRSSGSSGVSITAKVGAPAAPFTEFVEESVSPLEGVELHELPFTMNSPSAAAGIHFAVSTYSTDVCIDDVWIVTVD